MSLNKLILIFLSILLFSCGSSSSLQKELNNLPEWVQLKPQSNLVYYGIGKSKKNGYPDMYIKQSEKEALSDLAQQISVQVNTSSLLYQFEGQNIQSDFYMSKSNITATDYFEGYSVAKQYENKDFFWSLLQISKSDYLRIKKERKQKVLNKAHQSYKQAIDFQKNGELWQACLQFCKTLEIIKPYWNESTIFIVNNETIDLSQNSLENLVRTFNNVSVENLKEFIEINKGQFIDDNLQLFLIKNNKSKLTGFPYFIEYSESFGDKRKKHSVTNGKATSYPFKVNSLKNKEILKIIFNSKAVVNELTKDLLLRKILYNQINFSVSSTIDVVIKHPEVAFFFKTNLKEQSNNHIKSLLKKELLNKGIRTANSTANIPSLIINIERTSKGVFNIRSVLKDNKNKKLSDSSRKLLVDTMIYTNDNDILDDLINSINRNEIYNLDIKPN